MDLAINLSDADAQFLEQLARNKLNEYGKLNDVIGAQIFAILGRHARVLYYPLEDDDVWGFVEKTTRGNFVCINTSIEYDKQVFVAAHELYHVLQGSSTEELTLGSSLEIDYAEQSPLSLDELKANRFAAAFLISDSLLLQEMRNLNIPRHGIYAKHVMQLASIFVVPYKTMARRLRELEIIDDPKCNGLLALTQREISITKRRLGILTPIQDNKIVLGNLVEIAMNLYEQSRITSDKLEQILSYSNLSLEDMGITLDTFTPLTDAEIDALMED